MVAASAAFAPGNYTATPSKADITKVLGTLCSASCDSATVRSKLTSFYTACDSEITSQDSSVLMTYDVLYSLVPFSGALCSKDDAGNYCVLSSTAASNTSTKAVTSTSSVDTATLETYLTENVTASTASVSRRDDTVVTAPNATTFQHNNILYLFLNSSAGSSICTTCTTNIMAAYMDFEAAIPYAPGLAQSPLMGGQSTLIKGITAACGSAFLNSAVQAAGGISSSGSSDSSDAPRVASRVESIVSAVGGLLVASLFI